MSSRTLMSTIDHGVAFANNLFLFGLTYPKSEPVSVSLVDHQQRQITA